MSTGHRDEADCWGALGPAEDPLRCDDSHWTTQQYERVGAKVLMKNISLNVARYELAESRMNIEELRDGLLFTISSFSVVLPVFVELVATSLKSCGTGKRHDRGPA